MKNYIISILGIIVIGILIETIIPSGQINKYIKSIYAVFVVAVLINPLFTFFKQSKEIVLHYEDYEINKSLLNFVYTNECQQVEENIEKTLLDAGFENVDVVLAFSIENNEIRYNSCQVDLKNLVILDKAEHINKYELITKTIKDKTNLTEEEIVIYE